MVSLVGMLLLMATATAPAAAAEDAELQLRAADLKKIVGSVQGYFTLLEEEKLAKAKKELEELREMLDKLADKQKLGDPLSLVPEWREILRQSFIVEKPMRVSASGAFGSKPVVVQESYFDISKDEKEAKNYYDGDLKAFLSVPRDSRSKAHPVILALHPTVQEQGVSLKSMRKGSEVVKTVKEWVIETYPKELLESAIVVAPIMDRVFTDNGLVWSRPVWDSPEGMEGTFGAVQMVMQNLNLDPTRIFIDGHGDAGPAAIQFCSRFPGLLAGAIIRGPTPNEVLFQNCRESSFLMVGSEPKAFHDLWSKEEGFDLAHVDSLDAATLGQWLQEHSKEFCPNRVEIHAHELSYASAYWLKIRDFDRTLESRDPARIVGEVNRESNEITVTTSPKVKQFVIYLNDALVDLSKPVKVIHKTEAGDNPEEQVSEIRYEGTKARNLKDTLEFTFNQTTGNFGEVFVSDIQVEL